MKRYKVTTRESQEPIEGESEDYNKGLWVGSRLEKDNIRRLITKIQLAKPED